MNLYFHKGYIFSELEFDGFVPEGNESLFS